MKSNSATEAGKNLGYTFDTAALRVRDDLSIPYEVRKFQGCAMPDDLARQGTMALRRNGDHYMANAIDKARTAQHYLSSKDPGDQAWGKKLAEEAAQDAFMSSLGFRKYGY